jgi:hypothetical protein
MGAGLVGIALFAQGAASDQRRWRWMRSMTPPGHNGIDVNLYRVHGKLYANETSVHLAWRVSCLAFSE